jgi:anti-sigma regulatory factor (Ser/Thr protein kinase)
VSSQPHADIEIRIVSEPRYVCAVRHAIASLAKTMGMSETSCANLELAITEAIANIIKHGYHGDERCPIWVKATPLQQDGREGLEVVIEDECQGVDLDKIKSRPLDEIRPGGLGVHIIREIMDEVDYSHREAGVGVRLRMRKFITPAQPVSNE